MNILKDFIENVFLFSKKTNMEKEIYEQPRIIKYLIYKYIKRNLITNIDIPSNIENVVFIASGSSYHSAAIASFFFNKTAGIDSQYYYASEIVLQNNIKINKKTLYVFISQSGETSDTNKALNLIKTYTKNTLALTNTKNSSLYKNSDYRILTYAGKEKSIASTKAFSTQLFCLFLLAGKILQDKNASSAFLTEELINISQTAKKTFLKREAVNTLAKKISNTDNIVILATGELYPLAREGALKIKETSYINASAYPIGEFLHGHIALLNKKSVVIILNNSDSSFFAKNVINVIEKKYTAPCFIFSNDIHFDCRRENIIYLNEQNNINLMFSYMILLQLLALDISILLGKDIDNPRGLSKIVK